MIRLTLSDVEVRKSVSDPIELLRGAGCEGVVLSEGDLPTAQVKVEELQSRA